MFLFACATKVTKVTSFHTDKIKAECKIECKAYTVTSDEWCDCMHQCSQDVINKISFANLNIKIYIASHISHLQIPSFYIQEKTYYNH